MTSYTASPTDRHTAPPSRPDVIVVDDESAIVEVVCEALDDAHIQAESCQLGWPAHWSIREKQPKVVLLDVQMPGVSGIDLFYMLRGDPATQHIPVIFFTANAHKLRDEIPNYQTMGAELLPKPFDVQKLVDLVTDALAA